MVGSILSVCQADARPGVSLTGLYLRVSMPQRLNAAISNLNFIDHDRTGGAVAQLGARVNGIHEVAGSIPASSTNPRQG